MSLLKTPTAALVALCSLGAAAFAQEARLTIAEDAKSRAVAKALKRQTRWSSAANIELLETLGSIQESSSLRIKVDQKLLDQEKRYQPFKASGHLMKHLDELAKTFQVPMTLVDGILVVGDPARARGFEVNEHRRAPGLRQTAACRTIFNDPNAKARLKAVRAIKKSLDARLAATKSRRRSDVPRSNDDYSNFPALTHALMDKSEPVIIAALAALSDHGRSLDGTARFAARFAVERSGALQAAALDALPFVKLKPLEGLQIEELLQAEDKKLRAAAARLLSFHQMWSEGSAKAALSHRDLEVRRWATLALLFDDARRSSYGTRHRLNVTFALEIRGEELREESSQTEVWRAIRAKTPGLSEALLALIKTNKARGWYKRDTERDGLFGAAFAALNDDPKVAVPVLRELLAFQAERGDPRRILVALQRYGAEVAPARAEIEAVIKGHPYGFVRKSAKETLRLIDEAQSRR